MAQEKLEFEVDQAEAGPTIALSPEKEEQFARITRNLQEVTSGDIIRQVLSDGIVPRAYWGSATTGRPHIAYCVPLLKIADFLTAGVAVKILLAGEPRLSSCLWKNKLSTAYHRPPRFPRCEQVYPRDSQMEDEVLLVPTQGDLHHPWRSHRQARVRHGNQLPAQCRIHPGRLQVSVLVITDGAFC